VKQILFCVLTAILISGCASFQVTEQNDVYKMKTDMSPNSLSRAEYYEQLALSYSIENASEKAIEYFRLSLLHNPKRITPYLSLSDEYRKTKRNHLAIVELGEALKLKPDDTAILKKIADLYLETKIYSKAREVYKLILQKNSNFEEAEWAIFYIFKIEKKYTEALSSLVKINVNETNNFKIAYEKAMIYKLTKEYELYSACLAEAFALNPRDRQVVLEYVSNSYSLKQFKESTFALLNYLDTHEFDLEISQNLSYSAVKSENYELALREYDKQRPLTYDVGMIDLKKAHVYYLMNDLKNAEKLYLSLLQNEENDEARFYLAQIYITQDKADEAAFILGKLSTASDYYGEAQARLALYKKYRGQNDDAINTIRTAFIARPDQLVIYKTYADFMIENNRFVETVALLEKGIKLFPSDEDLRLKMAFLQYSLNNQKAFKKQIFAALKINPQSANIYSMLAELWYVKSKSPDEIVYFVNKAVELKSTNKNIKPLLAWALMQQNNSADAVAIFEEFYEENPKESFFARSLSQVYSRAGVMQKAKELADAAIFLESKESLSSNFMFKFNSQHVDAENFKKSPARLPASLEND
jgi:tetratricopeptide (TPR) repeat protein